MVERLASHKTLLKHFLMHIFKAVGARKHSAYSPLFLTDRNREYEYRAAHYPNFHGPWRCQTFIVNFNKAMRHSQCFYTPEPCKDSLLLITHEGPSNYLHVYTDAIVAQPLLISKLLGTFFYCSYRVGIPTSQMATGHTHSVSAATFSAR